MNDQPLRELPAEISAGETLELELDLTGCGFSPSTGWDVRLWLAGPALPDDSPFAEGILATASGDHYLVSVAVDVMGALTPGTYSWQLLGYKAGRVKGILAGMTRVTPNLAASTSGELEDPDEVLLAEVNAKILARVRKDMHQMSENQRVVLREELRELRTIRSECEIRLEVKRRGSNTRPPQDIAFRSPSSYGAFWGPRW